MSNFYLQFSETLHFKTSEEYKSFEAFYAKITQYVNDGTYADDEFKALVGVQDFQLPVTKFLSDTNMVHIFTEDDFGSPQDTCEIIHLFFKSTNSDGVFKLSWAETNSRPVPGGFSGGVCIATKNGTYDSEEEYQTAERNKYSELANNPLPDDCLRTFVQFKDQRDLKALDELFTQLRRKNSYDLLPNVLAELNNQINYFEEQKKLRENLFTQMDSLYADFKKLNSVQSAFSDWEKTKDATNLTNAVKDLPEDLREGLIKELTKIREPTI